MRELADGGGSLLADTLSQLDEERDRVAAMQETLNLEQVVTRVLAETFAGPFPVAFPTLSACAMSSQLVNPFIPSPTDTCMLACISRAGRSLQSESQSRRASAVMGQRDPIRGAIR